MTFARSCFATALGLGAAALIAMGACSSHTAASNADASALPPGAKSYPSGFGGDVPASCSGNEYFSLAAYNGLCTGSSAEVYALCVDGTYSAYDCEDPGVPSVGWQKAGSNDPPEAGVDGGGAPDTGEGGDGEALDTDSGIDSGFEGGIVDGGIFEEGGCLADGNCP
jgi:hypothetical protein